MFTEQDGQALLAVLDSGRLHMGQQVKDFEQAFARYVGVKHGVAVSSGAAGMHIALLAAAVGQKEEVIVPPLAPVAGPNAVFYQGAVNIFADVDPATGCVDPKDLIARINSNTRAIILHHYAGMPCDIQPVLDAVKDRDIAVIVDATHALGAKYQGRWVASDGDMVVFNFGPGNHIYTGEGGMIATNNDEHAQWLRMFRDEGFVREPHLLSQDEGPWHNEMQDIGYSYRMTELQAAVGLSQLKRLDSILAKRAEIAGIYNSALTLRDDVAVIKGQRGNTSAWGLYPLLLRDEQLINLRRQLYANLKINGVDVNVLHYPVFLHPYYLWAGHPDVCTLEGSRAPRAEDFYRRVLMLPISHEMTVEDAHNVIVKVITVLNR